ncbi:MAG: tRNA (adenine(22)-N(1))-methyltransferase [Bacillota bacterium]
MADIGTDHARLPVRLVLEGRCGRVIATDASPAALEAAGRTVRAYRLGDSIDLRLGDGLGVLAPGETSTIVVAGIGGLTIVSILAAGIGVARAQRMLVLQPMTHSFSLRRWALENGMGIVEEDLAQEGDRFYQVICLDPSDPSAGFAGATGCPVDIALELGPVLLRHRHALLRPMVLGLLRECQSVLDRMRGTVSRNDPRFLKWIERRDRLEGVLECLSG